MSPTRRRIWLQLDDDFTSIVEAVRLGRRIFDNLKGDGLYPLHPCPNRWLSLFGVLFRWPLILEPMDVAFLELIIDPHARLFSRRAGSADIIQRPPRPASERIFKRADGHAEFAARIGVLAVLLGGRPGKLKRGQGEPAR